MAKAVSSLDKALNNDPQWQAFIDTNAIIEPVTMGVQSVGGDEAILVSISPGAKTSTSTGSSDKSDFVLRANPQQWEKFFAADPASLTEELFRFSQSYSIRSFSKGPS